MVVAGVAGARRVETTERSLEVCLVEDGEVSWRLEVGGNKVC